MLNKHIEGLVGYGPYSCGKREITFTETAAHAALGPLDLGSGLVRFHKDKENILLSYFDNNYWCLFWQMGLDKYVDEFDVVGVDLGGFLLKSDDGKIHFKLTNAKHASDIILAVRDPERKFESRISEHPDIALSTVFAYDEQEKITIMILDLSYRTKYTSLFTSESPFDEDPDPGDWVQWAETATNDELLKVCGFTA